MSHSGSPSQASAMRPQISRHSLPCVSPIRQVKGPSMNGSFAKLPPLILPDSTKASLSPPKSDSKPNEVIVRAKCDFSTVVPEAPVSISLPNTPLKSVWNGSNMRIANMGRPIIPPALGQPLLPMVHHQLMLAQAQLHAVAQQQNQRVGGHAVASPDMAAANHFVEAHILYISNLHPAFTDDLLIEFLSMHQLIFQSPPRPKINDRPLSKETAGEVKFVNDATFQAAMKKLNGMDISSFLRERIFGNRMIGEEVLVNVNGRAEKFTVERRRNIFATRKMQRLQYEANMCQRGVFTYQLEKHNIQTSQELYELFDVVPELQKSIEQIRVAETRDKNGKAQKSRGCGHILFPNKEVLNDARVYLDGVGCPNTPYTRPLNEATKVNNKTFLRNPTNVHIKNIPVEFMTPEGQKKLEDLLVGITGTTGGAESLRRLELKESKFGHEGFASFCHHHQAEQVINELDSGFLSDGHRANGKALKIEFFEKQETRQARLLAQKKDSLDFSAMTSDDSDCCSQASSEQHQRLEAKTSSKRRRSRRKQQAGTSTEVTPCGSLDTPVYGSPARPDNTTAITTSVTVLVKSEDEDDDDSQDSKASEKIGQDAPAGQCPKSNRWSDTFLTNILRMAKAFSPLQLFEDLRTGSGREFYDTLLTYACRFAQDNYIKLPLSLRSKTDQERFSTSFVRDHIGQTINRPDCFTPGGTEFFVFHRTVVTDIRTLNSYLAGEVSVFCRHLQMKLSGSKFEDVMQAYQVAVTAIGRVDEGEKREEFLVLFKNLAMTKARHVINRDRSRTKHLHLMFTELAYFQVLEVQAKLPLDHPDFLFKADWQATDFKEAIQGQLRTFQYLSMKQLSQIMYNGEKFNRLYAAHHIVVKLAMTAQAKYITCKQTFCRDFLLFLRGRLILPMDGVKPPKKCSSIHEFPTIALLSEFAMKAVQTYFDVCLLDDKPLVASTSESMLQTPGAGSAQSNLLTVKRQRRRSSTSDMRQALQVLAARKYPVFAGAPYMLDGEGIEQLMKKITVSGVAHWHDDLAQKAFAHGAGDLNADQWSELYDSVLTLACRSALDDYNVNQQLEGAGVTVHNYVLGFRRQVAARIYYPSYISLGTKELPEFIGEVLACGAADYFQAMLACFRSYTLLRRHEVKYDELLVLYELYSRLSKSAFPAQTLALQEKIRGTMTAFVTHVMHNAVRNARTRKHVSHELYSEMDVFDSIQKSFRSTDAIFDGLPKSEQELSATARSHIDNYVYLDDAQLLRDSTCTTIQEQAICTAHHIVLKSALNYAKTHGKVQDGGEEHFCWHFFNFVNPELQLPVRQTATQQMYDGLAELWVNCFFNVGLNSHYLTTPRSSFDSDVMPDTSVEGSLNGTPVKLHACTGSNHSLGVERTIIYGRTPSVSSSDSGIERTRTEPRTRKSSTPIPICGARQQSSDYSTLARSVDSCFAETTETCSSSYSSTSIDRQPRPPQQCPVAPASTSSNSAPIQRADGHGFQPPFVLMGKDVDLLHEIVEEGRKQRPTLNVPQYMQYMQAYLVSKGGRDGLYAHMTKHGLGQSLKHLVEWEMPLFRDYERKMERQPMVLALAESTASMQGHRVALVRRYLSMVAKQLAADCGAPLDVILAKVAAAQQSVTSSRVNRLLRSFNGTDLDESMFSFAELALDLDSL